MTPEQFVYWIQGFFEIQEAAGVRVRLDELQVDVVKRHLATVFVNVTAVKEATAPESKSDDRTMSDEQYRRWRLALDRAVQAEPHWPSQTVCSGVVGGGVGPTASFC